jgi:hypothetical protein
LKAPPHLWTISKQHRGNYAGKVMLPDACLRPWLLRPCQKSVASLWLVSYRWEAGSLLSTAWLW